MSKEFYISSTLKKCLVFFSFFLAFSLHGIDTDFLVVFLEGSQILASLGELSLLHTLSHVPVDEGTLGVHQVELVVETSPGLGDGSSVGQHAHCALHLGQVTSRNDGGRLVVDADLEASGTPVHELDGALGLDGCDGCVDVLGDYVSTVQHAACHVLAVARVAFHHLVGWLEACIGDFSHTELLVVGLFG